MTDRETTTQPSPMDTIAAVSPILARYTAETLVQDVWQQPELSARDRGLITVAALITRSQSGELAHHVGLALDNGVTPAEIGEVVAHLAFYAGWGSATAAVAVIAPIFATRGIVADRLAPPRVDLMPQDEAGERSRVAAVETALGADFALLAGYTTDLFADLWLRPGLAPRDRSLVTVAALTAAGHTAQIGFHLGKAMDNGLTREEAASVITHLAFYAGWPNAMSAAGVAHEVFTQREAAAA